MPNIKKKGNKVWKLSTHDYIRNNQKLMRVVDNGNGITIKSYSWSSVYPDMYWSMNYAEASDLFDCLGEMDFIKEEDRT